MGKTMRLGKVNRRWVGGWVGGWVGVFPYYLGAAAVVGGRRLDVRALAVGGKHVVDEPGGWVGGWVGGWREVGGWRWVGGWVGGEKEGLRTWSMKLTWVNEWLGGCR